MTARETVEQALDRLSMDAAVWRTNPDTAHQAIGVDIAVHRVYDALAALAALPVATAGPGLDAAIETLIEAMVRTGRWSRSDAHTDLAFIIEAAAALRGAAAQADGGETPGEGLIPFDPTEDAESRRERQTAMRLGLPGFYHGNWRGKATAAEMTSDLCSEHGSIWGQSIIGHMKAAHGIEYEDYRRRIEAAQPGLADRLREALPWALAEADDAGSGADDWTGSE